jgi:uncharacterized protein (DUF2384 family)
MEPGNTPAREDSDPNVHVRLDELKHALAVEVTLRFSTAEIRAKIIENLSRWRDQGTWGHVYDEWKRIAESGSDEVLLATMCGTDDEANRLRQSAPYTGLLAKDAVRSLNQKFFPPGPDPCRVLAKATIRAARFWVVTDDELAGILLVDATQLEALRRQELELEPGSRDFLRAAQFVRTWIAVNSLFGGNDNLTEKWLRQPNRGLSDQTPIEVMLRPGNLAALASFVEALEDPYEAMALEGAAYGDMRPGTRWVRHRAILTLGSIDAAMEWLAKGQPSLGGRVPQEVMNTEAGVREVLRVIDSIEYCDHI